METIERIIFQREKDRQTDRRIDRPQSKKKKKGRKKKEGKSRRTIGEMKVEERKERSKS